MGVGVVVTMGEAEGLIAVADAVPVLFVSSTASTNRSTTASIGTSLDARWSVLGGLKAGIGVKLSPSVTVGGRVVADLCVSSAAATHTSRTKGMRMVQMQLRLQNRMRAFDRRCVCR